MIRIRLTQDTNESDLMSCGFEKVETKNLTYYKKTIGQYEIQAKLSFPMNLRIQNWPDHRAPWILFKFLLDLEGQKDNGGYIRLQDSGYTRVMKVQDTLDLIRDLSRYTDLKQRLIYWYKQYCRGKLQV